MDVVRGYLQSYDWGASDGLSRWAGVTGAPQAELWFGTHANGASQRVDGTGPSVMHMPILTKLLAAERPLSIQIHPAAELAEQMYAAQSQLGRPALLSDPFGKAEILIALEPFEILEGFRAPSVSAAVLTATGADLRPAVDRLAAQDIPGAVRLLLALDRQTVGPMAARLPGAMREILGNHDADIIASVVDQYPDDPGVFVAGLLNARTLQVGQAVYVTPGTVHAYVRGLGLEVMTNSDNVLRLGLTSKTVAVDEALAAADVAGEPYVCEPVARAGLRRYEPPGAPFRVTLVEDARFTAVGGRARTILCLEATASVAGVELQPGQAALVAAEHPDVDILADGRVVVADAP